MRDAADIEKFLEDAGVEMPEKPPIFMSPDEHEHLIRAEERAATEREIVETLCEAKALAHKQAAACRDMGDEESAELSEERADLCSTLIRIIERGEYRKLRLDMPEGWNSGTPDSGYEG